MTTCFDFATAWFHLLVISTDSEGQTFGGQDEATTFPQPEIPHNTLFANSDKSGSLINDKPTSFGKSDRQENLPSPVFQKQEKHSQGHFPSGTSSCSTTTDKTMTIQKPPRHGSHNHKNNTMINNNPVQSLVQNVYHAVEHVHKERQRRKSRRRISEALLTLRAAAQVHYEQQHRDDDAEVPAREPAAEHQQQQECWSRDLGAALLYPLPTTAMPLPSNDGFGLQQQRQSSASLMSATSSASLSEEHNDICDAPNKLVEEPGNTGPAIQQQQQQPEEVPVHILFEPQDDTNPRLLSNSQCQQLRDQGLPTGLYMDAWERIYSLGRDGDAFQTLLQKCRGYPHTIVVVRTTSGHVLGGFGSSAWQTQGSSSRSGSGSGGAHAKHSYYGTGVSFLFANHPADDNNSNDDATLSIYPWTGSNDFCQICDQERSVLAMGGAGAFGFILEDDFYRGSTDRCGTFGNPPLTPDKDGLFTVAAMEIYGLVPYGYNNSGATTTPVEAAAAVPTTMASPVKRSGFDEPTAAANTDNGNDNGRERDVLKTSELAPPRSASSNRSCSKKLIRSPSSRGNNQSNTSSNTTAFRTGSLLPRSAHCF